MDPISPVRTVSSPPSIPAPPSAPALSPPQDEYAPGARIFVPKQGGEFQRTTLIPADDDPPMLRRVGPDGEPRRAFTSEDGTKFHQMTEAGKVEFTLDVPDRVGQFLVDPAHGRYVLRTGQRLVSVDAASGQVLAEKPFGSFGFQRRMALAPDGQLMLADERTFSVLDRDLKAKESYDLDFRADLLKDLGLVQVLGDQTWGKIAVVSPGLKPLGLSGEARLDSLVAAPDGKVWFVEGTIRDGKPLKVVSYDPLTGESGGFRATPDAGYVVPLQDGRILVYDDRLAAPRVSLYGAEGDEQASFTMGKDCYLRQFFVTHDGRQAYAVTDRYADHGPTTRVLSRMDLSKGSEGLGGWISDRLGLDRPAEEIHRTVDEPFIPCVLDGGRVALLKEKGVEVLGEGSGLQDLAAFARSGPRPAAARIQVDSTTDRAIAGGLRDYIEAAAMRFDKPLPQEGDGWAYSARDAALHRTETVPGADALRELGLAGEQDYLKLTQARTLFNTVLQDRVVPFPGVPGGKVEVGTRSARTWLPGQAKAREIEIREPRYFTTALPLQVAGSPCLALASSDGMLSWHDLQSGTEQKFDVGSKVVGLMAGRDRLYAVAEDGRVLLLRVPVQPGEELLAPPEFQVQGAPPEAAPPIQEGVDSVLIGTVRLPRRA